MLGTPTTAGTGTFPVQVTDDVGNTARQSFTITIGTGKLDHIVITQAAFNSEKHELFVAANDPNTDVTVTVTFPGARQPRGCTPSGTGITTRRSTSARASTRQRSR